MINDPTLGVCECCGVITKWIYGFIYRDNDGFAVYQVAWCEGHPEKQVSVRNPPLENNLPH